MHNVTHIIMCFIRSDVLWSVVIHLLNSPVKGFYELLLHWTVVVWIFLDSPVDLLLWPLWFHIWTSDLHRKQKSTQANCNQPLQWGPSLVMSVRPLSNRNLPPSVSQLTQSSAVTPWMFDTNHPNCGYAITPLCHHLLAHNTPKTTLFTWSVVLKKLRYFIDSPFVPNHLNHQSPTNPIVSLLLPLFLSQSLLQETPGQSSNHTTQISQIQHKI